MDFEYTPEQEAFRKEVRQWLRANLPPELCVDDAMDERIAGTREVFEKRRRGRPRSTMLAMPASPGLRNTADAPRR